jgi:hypothetical protein
VTGFPCSSSAVMEKTCPSRCQPPTGGGSLALCRVISNVARLSSTGKVAVIPSPPMLPCTSPPVGGMPVDCPSGLALVGVAVAVDVAVWTGVAVAVLVGVWVAVGVLVGDAVNVSVAVGVSVGVPVGIDVRVEVGVGVGVTVGV